MPDGAVCPCSVERVQLIVEEDPAAVAATAARILTEELAVPGPATLGLAGGSTPAATYDVMARSPVEWERVTLWLGDERWVPPGDDRSNAVMAASHLGSEAAERLLAPDYSLGDPAAAAAAYASELREAFDRTGGRPGTILLGIGDDGHTASLFPEGEAQHRDGEIYTAEFVAKHDMWRLTATVPLLTSANHLVFLVTGAPKASILAEILDGGRPYPARVVAERAGDVTWIVDGDAASELRAT